MMKQPHSLIRLKSSLVNTPHLIDENSFKSIMAYVNSRIEGNADLTPVGADMSYGDPADRYVQDTKTGVMHVSGPLTYKTTGWEALCGGTSYEMLKDQMEYFVAKGAKTVAMIVDSGGGQAHGMIDSANYIRKLADDNGIKIIAYVDGYSCSAAYGISCIADEIVASSGSVIGSIGVLIELYNDTKALEKAGYERTFVTAGKDKVPYAEDGSFTKEFIDGLQDMVDTLYEGFTSHVAEARGMQLQAVKDTEANVFMTSDATELGLIDKVMTVEEFYDYLATEAQSNLEGNDMGIKDAIKLTFTGDKAEMAKLEELTAELSASQAARTAAETQLTALAGQLTAQADQITQLTTALEGFKAERAAAEQAAAAAKLESRKASLSQVLPVEQLEDKLAAYASLDDGTFSFVVSELAAIKEARAESFKPVGEEGVEESTEETTPEANLLAAGIAAAKALRR
jgi:signal peptide peptidase SppA